MRILLLIFIISCFAAKSVKAQYYTGRLSMEFNDSLKNIVPAKFIADNKVKSLHVYKLCNKDSVLVFKSWFDKNGFKTEDKVYEKNTLVETRKFKDNRICQIEFPSGRKHIYKYYSGSDKGIDSIHIHHYNDTLAPITRIIYVYNIKSVQEKEIYIDYSGSNIDTVEMVNDQHSREKYLKSVSIEGKKHSVSEYLIYRNNLDGNLSELEHIQILIGLKRFTVLKKIDYNKNGLVDSVSDSNGCRLIFKYFGI